MVRDGLDGDGVRRRLREKRNLILTIIRIVRKKILQNSKNLNGYSI
jgi:hypothetical protein